MYKKQNKLFLSVLVMTVKQDISNKETVMRHINNTTSSSSSAVVTRSSVSDFAESFLNFNGRPEGTAIPFVMEEDRSQAEYSGNASRGITRSAMLNSYASESRKPVKFNLHLIEACNYSCRHCFAKFGSRKMLSFDNWRTIVDNCLRAVPGCSFNIAGGEPLLAPYFHDLVRYCHDRGSKVSVITNGYLITDKWIRENAGILDTLGLSLDSFDEGTLVKMGRCTRSGKILTAGRIKEITTLVKEVNPDCRIKVNTVVCSLNRDEIVREQIMDIPVSRWKIFKMMSFANDSFNNSDIVISDEEYMRYISNNLGTSPEMLKDENSHIFSLSDTCSVVVEKNLDGGYLMIDANGNLVDNTINTNYVPVVNCVTGDVRDGINRLGLDTELYWSRY